MVMDTVEWFRRLADSTGESRDGKGSGDHDVSFAFGNPRACLTTMAQARLTIMRGYILDVSHAPWSIRGQLRYGGDDDHVQLMPSGIYVPLPHEKYWSEDES